MKKQEITIAEILHYAADYCLYDDYYEFLYNWYPNGEKQLRSCWAIRTATEHFGVTKLLIERIMIGLRNLGLDPSNPEMFPSSVDSVKFPSSNDPVRFHEIQQQRYAWLKFCALLAEEQGV